MAIAGRSIQGTTVISGAAQTLNDLGRNTLADPVVPVLTTPGPIVVTTQNLTAFQQRQGWGLPASDQNLGPVYRGSLQDPPVLTTPGPIVVAKPYPKVWFDKKEPRFSVAPVIPPIPPGTKPIVVSTTRPAQFLFEQGITTRTVIVPPVVIRQPMQLGGTVADQNMLAGNATVIDPHL